MRTTLLIGLAVTSMVMTGCGPLTSVHPLWDDAHRVSEPALEGMWLADEGDAILMVTPTKDKGLRMVYATTDGVSRYEVHVLKLGERLFLDLCPDSESGNGSPAGESFMPSLPLHFFARMELRGDTLKLALLDEDAFAKKAESGDVKISRTKAEDAVVLTASTRELQEFISSLEAGSELWGEEGSWYRKPPAKAGSGQERRR